MANHSICFRQIMQPSELAKPFCLDERFCLPNCRLGKLNSRGWYGSSARTKESFVSPVSDEAGSSAGTSASGTATAAPIVGCVGLTVTLPSGSAVSSRGLNCRLDRFA